MGVWACGRVGDHQLGAEPARLRPVYPYILLNLFLSMIAGLQGAILLIVAKRADSISAELAMHTFDNTETQTRLLEENTELTRQVKANTDPLAEIHRHVAALTAAITPALPEV